MPGSAPGGRARVGALVLVLIAALAAIALASLCAGNLVLSPVAALDALAGGDTPAAQIVHALRLPRLIAALMVGASLAVAGALMQGMTRNPLADPTLTGVVSGAALAVVAVTVLVPGWSAGLLPFAALAGGGIAATLTFALAWRAQLSPLRLSLAGTTIAALGSAGVISLMIVAGPQAGPLFYWLAGGFAGVGWQQVAMVAPWTVAGLGAALAGARVLDTLALGDEAAQGVGLDLMRWRLMLGGIAVALSASVVSIAGPVGFVGLCVPHLVRAALGGSYRRTLGVTALAGALLVAAADLVARTVAAPRELPVGFLTALVATPLLIAMIRRDEGVSA
ncbi:iron ABC transporter permease [Burkholderia sp. Ac-20349]|uniref:Ferrichrome ABC transporter permease n=2 Tax=Burkholderia aenigmatica TaxID=2015348 RepID=A0A228IHU0_9BURK|nr:iron ABC transporter permease [Burkholderia sp. Ac-20349]MBN3839756.1 iron ABC transporter permease [Burkholderia sp. Ac-20349]OXI41984.1 ferrichrome ABC transporter permease [Burkholderia aenigmatica]